MDILLYNNTSERNALTKTLTNQTTYTGILKNDCSVINPTFILNETNPSGFNYAYIAEFARYYYIVDVISISNGIWEITLMCDVLMSFASDILSCSAIVEDTETNETTNYIESDIYQALVKTKTDILEFPNGLLDSGEYILITAGG